MQDNEQQELGNDDVARVASLHAKYGEIRRALSEVVVGQNEVVEQVLVAVFSRGHALLVGVPGLAKTLLVRTLAEVLDLGFKRVQFTPDLIVMCALLTSVSVGGEGGLLQFLCTAAKINRFGFV